MNNVISIFLFTYKSKKNTSQNIEPNAHDIYALLILSDSLFLLKMMCVISVNKKINYINSYFILYILIYPILFVLFVIIFV
jgi:hypothetical protein